MKIYLLHTQFNSRYQRELNKKNAFLTSEDEEGNTIGFGETHKLACIYWNDALKISFDNDIKRDNMPEKSLLLVSDKLFQIDEHKTNIVTLIENIIDGKDRLVVYYHSNDNYRNFKEYFANKFKKQILKEGSFHHLGVNDVPNGNYQDNPFYDLVNIVNSENEEDFSTNLNTLDARISDEESKEKKSLEAKLNFLHQCLTPDGLKDATLKDEWSAESEFENLKNVKDGPFGNDYLEALRSLRDKLWAN